MIGKLRLYSQGSAALVAALLLHNSLLGEFTLIGTPKIGLSTPARALSPDGSTLVGDGLIDDTTTAIYWTASDGMVALPHASEVERRSYAYDISDDGSVIVGESRNDDKGDEAVRWDRQPDGSYTVTMLTPPVNDTGAFVGPVSFFGQTSGATVNMTAVAVSGDGTIIVGTGDSTTDFGDARPPREAWMWTAQNEFTGLGFLSGGAIEGKTNPPRAASLSYDIDQSGSTIVGSSWPGLKDDGYVATEAFVYAIASSQMTGIGDLVTPVFGSQAHGISPDGSVIVGQARDSVPSNQVAFRYTAQEGMQSLGDLPGGTVNATANAVSLNGKVIVGEGNTDRGTEAFVWTERLGMVLLETVAGLTVEELGAGHLETAVAVSHDGQTIAGSYIIPDNTGAGQNLRQAYVIRLSREQLQLGAVPDGIEDTIKPLLIQQTADNVQIRFSRDPSAEVSYLLQGTDNLAHAFEDLIRYRPDGNGGFQREILKPDFRFDSTGSTPANVFEGLSTGSEHYFLRVRIDP